MKMQSPGLRFRNALKAEKPLQIVGTLNAYIAMLAEQSGFIAIYLSGAGVANSLGLPDLAITHLGDVLEDARRITNACALPLLVDIDTGWGHAFTIARAVKEMIKAGVAAVHIEDQINAKRCGHRPSKTMVSAQEMQDRIKAAVDAKTDDTFVIMARTDALTKEGLEPTLERIHQYIEAGADMIFLEGAQHLSEYKAISKAIQIPLLANMTEFGITPLHTTDELAANGVAMVLYPLTAFRVLSAAVLNAFQTLRKEGSQKSLLNQMQTREKLYEILDYQKYEHQLDQFIKGER